MDPLEIKSGPRWRVQFWSLFGPFIVANLLKRLFQVETDLTSNSCGWNLELFEALIANSMLACVMLMCFYMEQRSGRRCRGGLETGPSRRHRIQPAEGPFLRFGAKETYLKKGSESGPA